MTADPLIHRLPTVVRSRRPDGTVFFSQ